MSLNWGASPPGAPIEPTDPDVVAARLARLEGRVTLLEAQLVDALTPPDPDADMEQLEAMTRHLLTRLAGPA